MVVSGKNSSGAQKTPSCRYSPSLSRHQLEPNLTWPPIPSRFRIGSHNLPAHTSHMTMPQPRRLLRLGCSTERLAARVSSINSFASSDNTVRSLLLAYVSFWNEIVRIFVAPTKRNHLFRRRVKLPTGRKFPDTVIASKGRQNPHRDMMYNRDGYFLRQNLSRSR